MRAHFAAVAELQAAIAQGRLIDARETARWFASHEMDAPPSWSPYVDEMRYAAMRIERAKDVAAAGAQIGRLGRACSSCHQAQDAHPAFAYEPPPTDVNTLEAQMARHQWAAARLWEGVVGPADQLWDEGARVMAMTRFDVAKSAHEKPNPDVIELAERLRDQSTQAITIKDHNARAAFFGDMMETCASCHSIVRPAPVVSARQEE
jgi:cytochrome c556